MIGPFGLRPKATVSRRALPLARALARRGWRVTLLVPSWDWPADAGRTFEDAGVRVVCPPLPPRLPGLHDLWLAHRLYRSARPVRPAILHFFKPKGYSGLAHLEAWLWRRLGHCDAGLVVDEDDWEGAGGWNEIGGYSWAQRAFFDWQEQFGLRRADAITVASRVLVERVEEMRGRGVFYLPNGVDSEAVESPGWPESPRPLQPTLLLYSRFFEFDVARVVRLLVAVDREVPGVRLRLVGRGFGDEEARLLAEARAAGLADRVERRGWLEGMALRDALVTVDLAIYPLDDRLLNRTKCPAKLADLLAAGVPVVADRVGEAAGYIEDGVSGVLVAAGDEAAWARAVIGLLQNEKQRRQVSEAARRRMAAMFTWDRLAERAEAAYDWARLLPERAGDGAAWVTGGLGE